MTFKLWLSADNKILVNEAGFPIVCEECPCDDGPPRVLGEQCAFCTGDTPPRVRLTISGVANGDCGNCNSWNREFILVQIPETPCRWAYDITLADNIPRGSGSCGAAEGYIELLWHANIQQYPIGGGIYFGSTFAWGEDTYVLPRDCTEVLVVPMNNIPGWPVCDFSGATATLEPIWE